MADPVTDDRLREIATSDPLVLAISAQMGEPSWADIRAIAAELRAARETIRSKDRLLPSLIAEGVAMERERAATAEAEVERLRGQLQADDQRAWEALGRPEGTHDTTNVQRLCAEVARLRGELREVAAFKETVKWPKETNQ